jgi:hypothetical protein
MAETEGFEPSIRLTAYDDLANRCLQPLGHVSAGLVEGFCRDLEAGASLVVKQFLVAHGAELAQSWDDREQFAMRSKMRFMGVVLAGAVFAVAGPALAYENFLPLGTGYSTDVTSIPAFDSKQGEINQQADIIETEIYRERHNEALRESHLNRFFSDAEVSGSDTFIDY